MGRTSFKELILKPSSVAPQIVHNALGAKLYSKLVNGFHQVFGLDGTGVEHQLSGGDIVETILATGAIRTSGQVSLNSVTPLIAGTLANPGVAGITLVISQIDAGTAGHTVTTATAAGFDGTNNTATFNAAFETLVLRSVSATRWVIVENIGAVTLSAV